MPTLEIYQQSLIGDIVKFPYYILKFILKILFLPFYAIFYVVKVTLIWLVKIFRKLMPEIYLDNLKHSFKALFCTFKTLFAALTFCVILLFIVNVIVLFFLSLLPDNILGLAGLSQFDFPRAIMLIGRAFLTKELLFVGLSLLGFLLSFVIVAFLITLYSPVESIVEFFKFPLSKIWLLALILLVSLIEYFLIVYIIS